MSKPYVPTERDIRVVKAIASDDLKFGMTSRDHIIDLRFYGYVMVDGDGEIYLTSNGWDLAKNNGWKPKAK
jgi:hypothetical protein